MGKKKNKRRAEGNDNNDRSKKKPQPKDQHKSNVGNGKAYVQILGNGMDTQDTSPSVLLFFDNRRFLFNVGERLQRFFTENKLTFSKIDDILLSRLCSETAGGLPGLLLTLTGMGEEGMSVNVWVPPDLDQLVEAMKSFVPNAAMVHTHSVLSTHGSDEVASVDSLKFDHLYVPIVDEVVKICAIPLRLRCLKVCDPTKEGSSKLNAPLVDDYHLAEDLQAQMMNSAAEDALDPGDISVVYICEFPEIKGKLDRDKAAELGLESGPKYGELKRGNPVK